MRNRAAREGWRRTDQPWTPPNTLDPDDEGVLLEHEIDGDLDRVELRQLAFVAWRRMQRAVLRGQAAEALRWRRVRLILDAEAVEEGQAMEQEQRRWDYLHSPVEVDCVLDRHGSTPLPLEGEGAGDGVEAGCIRKWCGRHRCL